MIPWHGQLTPMRLRKLSQVQAQSCGNFSMIELFEDKIRANKKPTVPEMAAYAQFHDKLCKLAMVTPTYDEAMAIAGAHVNSKDIQRQLDEIQALATQMEKSADCDPVLLKELADDFSAVELQSKFLLPADCSSVIVNYSLSISESDIKSITEDMLMNAAVLAQRGHDNPSDHLKGVFTDLMRLEIDNRAWIVFEASRKNKAG